MFVALKLCILDPIIVRPTFITIFCSFKANTIFFLMEHHVYSLAYIINMQSFFISLILSHSLQCQSSQEFSSNHFLTPQVCTLCVVSFLTYLKAEVGSRLEMRSASCEFQKIEQSLSRRLRGYYSCPVKHVPRSLGPWSKSQLQGCWSLWPQRSVCLIRGFPNASSSSSRVPSQQEHFHRGQHQHIRTEVPMQPLWMNLQPEIKNFHYFNSQLSKHKLFSI